MSTNATQADEIAHFVILIWEILFDKIGSGRKASRQDIAHFSESSQPETGDLEAMWKLKKQELEAIPRKVMMSKVRR